MTASNDVVERITEVLRAHIWYFVGNLGVPGMPDQKGYKCYCGWETHADGEHPADDPHTHVAAAVVAELQPELGELEATKLLLAATRAQLSRTIADFCAVRDALPRQQVEQILSSVQAEAESSEEPNVNVVYDCHNDGDLDQVWLGYRLDERRRREDGI